MCTHHTKSGQQLVSQQHMKASSQILSSFSILHFSFSYFASSSSSSFSDALFRIRIQGSIMVKMLISIVYPAVFLLPAVRSQQKRMFSNSRVDPSPIKCIPFPKWISAHPPSPSCLLILFINGLYTYTIKREWCLLQAKKRYLILLYVAQSISNEMK